MKISCGVIVALLFTLHLPSWAASDPVGQAKFVVGAVNIENENSDAHPLRTGDPVYQGDLLSSKKNGYAVIALIDETKFTLKPNTEFRIKRVNNEESDQEILTELLKGGLKVITGQVAKQQPDRFNVETPLGSIGVRGTQFDLQLCLSESDCALIYQLLGELFEKLDQGKSLFVLVNEGVTVLLDCADTPNVPSGYAGLSNGDLDGCEVIKLPSAFFRNFLWQDDQELDQLLNSLNTPVLQEIYDEFLNCAGDPVCIQCQGDPICLQCNGDPSCYQCQGDPLCTQCQGDPLCIQCLGDPLCIQCIGDPLCIQCNGDPLCIQCNGDAQCIQCNGDPLCLRCNSDSLCIQCNDDPLCVRCNGDPLCIQCNADPLCDQCNGDAQCIQCGGNPLCIGCNGDPLCIKCNGDPLCVQCNADPLCIQCNGDPLCIQCNGDPLCIQCNNDPQCLCQFNQNLPQCGGQ